MENLVEEVASQPLKAKWKQLYSRLGLRDHRNMFQIVADHSDKSEGDKFRCCILDTIDLWKKSGPVARQSEKEKMKLLLTALRNIQGFEAVALRLSEKHNIPLKTETALVHKAKPSKPSPGHSKLSKGVLLKDEAHVSLPVTEQTIIHQQDATEEPAAAAECSSGDTVARVGRRESDTPSIQAERSVPSTDSSPSQRHQDMELESPPMTTSDSVVSERVEVESSSSLGEWPSAASERRREMLQVPIDMENTIHKFAILDVVQRISVSHWTFFSSQLGLSKDAVQKLSEEKATEERYYKAIKEWLKVKRQARATFADLDELLNECSQHGAQIVMKKRLEYNRDVLQGASVS